MIMIPMISLDKKLITKKRLEKQQAENQLENKPGSGAGTQHPRHKPSIRTVQDKTVISGVLNKLLLRGFAKLEKFQKKLDGTHPTSQPPSKLFFFKPIIDMERN